MKSMLSVPSPSLCCSVWWCVAVCVAVCCGSMKSMPWVSFSSQIPSKASFSLSPSPRHVIVHTFQWYHTAYMYVPPHKTNINTSLCVCTLAYSSYSDVVTIHLLHPIQPTVTFTKVRKLKANTISNACRSILPRFGKKRHTSLGFQLCFGLCEMCLQVGQAVPSQDTKRL